MKRRSISLSGNTHALITEHARAKGMSTSSYIEALVARDLGTPTPRAQRARTATEIARARDAAAVGRAAGVAAKVLRSQNTFAPPPTGEPAARRVIDNAPKPTVRATLPPKPTGAASENRPASSRVVVPVRPGGAF